MNLKDFFPVYNRLTKEEQQLLDNAVFIKDAEAGTMIHSADSECTGFIIVQSGQLRAFISSDEGKEITLYRLLEQDMCLFSASCIMKNIQFDISLEVVDNATLFIIPARVYQGLMERSHTISQYTNELMSSRFSEVMWLMEQILWRSFDKRLATFLLEERALENSDMLHITHEQIARHLGSAREVVTRMLKHFQLEDALTLSRGTIHLTNIQYLSDLTE